MNDREAPLSPNPGNCDDATPTGGDSMPLQPPEVLIVKNVPDDVFGEGTDSSKADFESLFIQFDRTASFTYLKFFRRVRVQLATGVAAASAKARLHDSLFMGRRLKCYFMKARQRRPMPADDVSSSREQARGDSGLGEDRRDYLAPPEPRNLFLLSPPASPPVGWQQYAEREPVVNYDLLAAVAELAPGEAHELYAGTDTQPKIVVHIAADDSDGGDGGGSEANDWRPKQPRLKIPQTRCPARNF